MAIFMLMAVVSLSPVMGQQHEKKHDKKHREITEIVSNLTASQKRKVEQVGKESKERIDVLRRQKKSVCDSIGVILNSDEDRTADIYRLFEREAQIQVQINKEMYSAKLRVDALLTDEQRAEIRRALEEDRKRHR